jgi:transcriptional antiterminator NusG
MADLQTSTTKQWYVVHTRTGKENSVVLRLQDRIQTYHLEDKFGEIVVPTEEVVEMRAGQKRKTERKFFPGYVWVEMMMDPQTWHFIKDVPGVIGFIGGQNPTPIPPTQADNILRRVQEGAKKPKPKILFETGEVVRVTEGPFADFNGVVEDVNYEKNRLRVSVLIFGRATPVELEFGQVEKSG